MILYDLRLDGTVYSDVTPPFTQSGLMPGQAVAAEVRARDTESGEEGAWSPVTTAATPLPESTVEASGEIAPVEAHAAAEAVVPEAVIAGVAAIDPVEASAGLFQGEPESAVTATGEILPVEAWASVDTVVGDRMDGRVSGIASIPAVEASAAMRSSTGLTVHPDRVALIVDTAGIAVSVSTHRLDVGVNQ
jgi:hypothetical protein